MSAITGLPRRTYVNGQRNGDHNEDGNCAPMFSRECIGAIEQQALRSGGGGCSAIFNQVALDPPAECEGAMDGSWDAMKTSLFQSKGDDDDDDAGDSANCYGAANENSTVHTLFGVTKDAPDSEALDQTDYDEVIYLVVPFLTVIVSDRVGSGGDGSSQSSRAELTCLRAKNIVPGSREAPALQATTANTAAPGSSPAPDSQNPAGWGRGLSLGGTLASVAVSAIILG